MTKKKRSESNNTYQRELKKCRRCGIKTPDWADAKLWKRYVSPEQHDNIVDRIYDGGVLCFRCYGLLQVYLNYEKEPRLRPEFDITMEGYGVNWDTVRRWVETRSRRRVTTNTLTKLSETTRCNMCEKTIPAKEGKAIVSKMWAVGANGERRETAKFDLCSEKCRDELCALLELPSSLEEQQDRRRNNKETRVLEKH